MRRLHRLLFFAIPFLVSSAALASKGGHADPVAPIALRLALVLLAAKLGGDLAVRLRQPAVLGELIAGVLLGNARLLGVSLFEPIEHGPFIDMLARLGVLLLLFEVGLESTVGQMLKVGWSALLVAVLGVAAPFALGWLVGAWLLPDSSWHVHAFLGSTLCATSVGITARVLKDIGRSQTAEARIILGAAVIDDVLGLIVLAIVGGIIAAADGGHALGMGAIALVVGKAVGFLVGAIGLGMLLVPRLFGAASRLRGSGVFLAVGLILCFFLAWLADALGLAPIVGAFAAGLVLEPSVYARFAERGEGHLEELVAPLSSFLVPVFFVLMGMRTELRAFAQLDVLGLAAALTAAAIIGKQACSLGVLARGVDRLSIGIGMVPRGEVGLIFANIGLTLTIGGAPVVSPSTYSAVVVMVIFTTMITPPALTWSLRRRGAAR